MVDDKIIFSIPSHATEIQDPMVCSVYNGAVMKILGSFAEGLVFKLVPTKKPILHCTGYEALQLRTKELFNP